MTQTTPTSTKLIIAGSRHFDDEIVYAKLVDLRCANDPRILATEIVSGGARGVDTAGEMYGDFYDIPVKRFPADWSRFGKSAGPKRNLEMARYADALLLIWNGASPGSFNMKQRMLGMGKHVFEIILKDEDAIVKRTF